MENVLQNPRKAKCKVAIIVLSVCALFIGLISNLLSFIGTVFDGLNGNFRYILELLDRGGFEISLVRVLLPYFLALPLIVMTLLPCILLLLYVLFFYKKFSARLVLSLVFLAFTYYAFTSAIFFVLNIVSLSVSLSSDQYYQQLNLRIVFVEILPRLPLILAAILALVGIKNRVVYIISLALALVSPIYLILDSFKNLFLTFRYSISYLLNGMFDELIRFAVYRIWDFGDILLGISMIAIIVAVMIFVIANNNLITKPKKIKAVIIDPDVKNLSAEDAFNVLKIKLNLGEISEQEYAEQRALIINRM